MGTISVGGFPALAVSQIEIGILTCDASTGIDATKEISLVCDFQPTDSPPETYSAILKKNDLSVAAKGRLVWTVTAKKAPDHSGGLAGDYFRTPTGALVGGIKKSFTLYPAASENGAQAVAEMTVVASN
jgi:hypothetical protein